MLKPNEISVYRFVVMQVDCSDTVRILRHVSDCCQDRLFFFVDNNVHNDSAAMVVCLNYVVYLRCIVHN